MLADALGRPLRFIVTAGQVGDTTQVHALRDDQASKAVLADKAYDSTTLHETIKAVRAEAVVPGKRSRKIIIPHDSVVYRYRDHLKHFQRFATRYERRTIHLTAITIWLR